MFNLFGKNSDEVAVNDQVWMNTNAKRNAIVKMAQASDNCHFVCWFENTKSDLEETLRSYNLTAQVSLADNIVQQNGPFLWLFVEHYPLADTEQALFKKLGLSNVPVLSALDEPFFQHFSGERMVTLMQRLGMNEDEIVAHSMITRAIKNAQKKIAQQVRSEKRATSQTEWYKVNLGKGL
ncbi:MAG: hypothetical protein AB7O48_15415 [Cyclobacteriaceae bacterium]